MKVSKLRFIVMILLAFGENSYARPRGPHTLVRPSTISLIGKGVLKVTFDLPCTNKDAADWASLVFTSDDEGDGEVNVGVVASLDDCKTGSSQTFSVTQKVKDMTGSNEVTFVPMPVLEAAPSTHGSKIKELTCMAPDWSLSLKLGSNGYDLKIKHNAHTVVATEYQFISDRPVDETSELQYYFTDTTDGGLNVYENTKTGRLSAHFDQLDAYVKGFGSELEFTDCTVRR